MKTQKDLMSDHSIKLLVIGTTGSGKTHLAGTFPKSWFLSTEPGGMTTVTLKPELKKNIVGWDEFIPISVEDTKHMFARLEEACKEARTLAKEGKIETLVLDNLTYLAENRWLFINKHQPLFSKGGEKDTRGMYGTLGRWLYEFVLMQLLSCPCNVVVTVHEKLEDEEAMERKPDKSNPIVPNILGGFRDVALGMFSCVFFLQHKRVMEYIGKKEVIKYRYTARTRKGKGMNAKNRYDLPEVIENVSYHTIRKALEDSMKEVKVK